MLFRSVSPDGTKLAYIAEGGGGELYVLNLLDMSDGMQKTRLTWSYSSKHRPAWSPDGKKVLFESEADGNHEIYLINADGTGLRNLTNHKGNDYKAAWSPDGAKIAFVSDRDGNAEVYVMNADGSNVTNVSKSPALDTDPVWAPVKGK